MGHQAGHQIQLNHTSGNSPAPVKVSLSWLKVQNSVPVCGGNFQDEWRSIQSLSLRSVKQCMPDGSIRVLIPPGRWIVQFLCVIAAGMGLAVAAFVPVSLIRQNQVGMVPVLAAGGLLGLLASRWLIRKHPTLLLTWQPEGHRLIADNGNLCVERANVSRLILVTGKGAITVAEHPGVTVTDHARSYGVLLLQRKDAPADEAELIFRHALPESTARKAARLTSDMLQVPLMEWEAGTRPR